MKKTLLIIVSLLLVNFSFSQKVEAYKIYNAKGKALSADKMLKGLEKFDVVLFGEFHNNPISHWLEYEVGFYLSEKYDVSFGAEMFEADNQKDLNRYLKNEINKEAFDTLVRLWPNYETDYSQLIFLAKRINADFIATNIPRRYASMVHKGGFEALDTLPQNEKAWIAPLPIEYDPELPGYKKMMGMMMGHSSPNLPKAQAIKDATMAYFIIGNYKPGYKFIHYNGAYHSDNYEGIGWYLRQKAPELKVVTISTVTQKDVNKLYEDNVGIADYIIVVDSNMTTSY
ncbi:MAG: ChaN family lipoprotein [Bacteroidales bacterium]|nr:ChaN family lipoprotein [Bacteroidales bacterium]MDD4216875.1 ChaN family lipoprotein [Bacteroidales bacterium]MDY0143077.1 ChaN family lipoprotein [Bacteroidales bacterium]